MHAIEHPLRKSEFGQSRENLPLDTLLNEAQ